MASQKNDSQASTDAVDADSINDTILNRWWIIFAIKFLRKRNRSHGSLPFLPWNVCVKYGSHVHLSEAHTLRFVAENTSIPMPTVHCAFQRKGITYIVMSRIRGTGVGFGWESRSAKSKEIILNQLKAYIQQLRDLTPPRDGYVGALEGCHAYDLRIPAIQRGFTSVRSVKEFHHILRENVDQVTGPDEQRKADFARLVFLQNACANVTHFSHGDLSAHNILVEGNDITGIIDWDTSGWYPDYWEYARRKCDCHPFEEVWSNETDRFLESFNNAIEMENLRINIFGRL